MCADIAGARSSGKEIGNEARERLRQGLGDKEKQMSRNVPDRREYPGESRIDWLHRLRDSFIVYNLQFGPDREVSKEDVRKAYLEWIGEPDQDYHPPIIRALYDSIECLGAERVPERDWPQVETFKGVRIIS